MHCSNTDKQHMYVVNILQGIDSMSDIGHTFNGFII